MAPTDFVRTTQTVLTRAIYANHSAPFSGALNKTRALSAQGSGVAGACEVGIDLGVGNTLSWIGGRFGGPSDSAPQEHRNGQPISMTIYVGDDPTGAGRVALTTMSGTQSPNMTLTAANASPVAARCIWLSTPQASGSDGTDYSTFVPVYDGAGGGNPPPPPPPSGILGCKRFIGVHTGQSHMAAPGPLGDLSLYNIGARWAVDNFPVSNQWVENDIEPFNPPPNGQFSSGALGPSLSLAATLADNMPGWKQGVVLRARGSTALGEFVPGGSLYPTIIADAQAALAASPTGSKIGYVALWQGESGPGNWDSVFLNQFVTAYRQAFSNPNLRIVFVVVDPRFGGVAALQKNLGLPLGVGRVTLDDLTIPSSGDINDPTALRTVGQRIAHSLLGMAPL